MTNAHEIHDPKHVKTYLLAGRATVTLVSERTGARYTFRVNAAKDNDQRFFVSLLTGPDNESSYTYVGMIENGEFRLTKASKFAADSLPVRGFNYFWRHAVAEQAAADLTVMHAGRCGRCNRLLTVPASLKTGLGEDCAAILGVTYDE